MCVMKMILDSPKYILGDQGQSVGSGEKARRKFSSTGGRASGYRLSPDHFQTVKRMLAPDWARKNALYYCASAQSANSRVIAPGCPRMAKVGRQKGST